jgi:lysophospholipase L1-like esterase
LNHRLVFLTALLLSACGADPVPEHDGTSWVATWTASPTDTASLPLLPGNVVRQFLTPHAGGKRVRLRLSNRLGNQAIALGAVTLGLRAQGAALLDGSVRALSFGGAAGITLVPGAEAVSDPVDFPVAPFHKIGVSLLVAAPVTTMPRHFQALEIPYLSVSGGVDAASDAGFAPLTPEQANSFFVASGLEVEAGVARETIVALGDSVTDGYVTLLPEPNVAGDPAVVGLDLRYPDFLQRRLLAAGRGDWSVVNAGISGNRVNADGFQPPFGPSLPHRLAADVLAVPGLRAVILLEGINDLGLQVQPDARALIDGLDASVRELQAHGIRVVLGTIMPALGFGAGPAGELVPVGILSGTPAVDDARRAVNDWIRGASSADAVVDFATCLADAANPSRIDPAYDSGDHLHPNPAGYQAMAQCVDLQSL